MEKGNPEAQLITENNPAKYSTHVYTDSRLSLQLSGGPSEGEGGALHFYVLVHPSTLAAALQTALLGPTLGAGEVAARAVILQAVAHIRRVLQQQAFLVVHLVVLLVFFVDLSIKFPHLSFGFLRIKVNHECSVLVQLYVLELVGWTIPLA